MQAEGESTAPNMVIVKQGDKYYVSVGLLEYDLNDACSDEQRDGVRAVMDLYNQNIPTSPTEAVMLSPRPGVPKPLNTGYF